MATREGPEVKGEREGDGSGASSSRVGPQSMSRATVNINTTTIFKNCGQIVQVGGSNNTVVMAGNRVHVMQENVHHPSPPPECHGHNSSQRHTAHDATGSPSSPHIESRDALVTYAQGIPYIG